MLHNDLAMLVVSCDSYTDLGEIFFDLQEKNMGWFDGPRYFVNESKFVEFPGVQVLHVGNDVNWSGKVNRALQQIPEKYILFMLEDYFIGKMVKRDHLDDAMNLIQKHQLRYYKITETPNIRKKSHVAEYVSPIPSNVRYGINLQAAIFEKDYLQNIIAGPDRSAWETETDLLKEVTSKFEYDIPGCVVDHRNIIDIHNGVIKGCWVPSTVKYFKKQGYEIDLGNREILSKKGVTRRLLAKLSHVLPTGLLIILKRIFISFGFKFVSDN